MNPTLLTIYNYGPSEHYQNLLSLWLAQIRKHSQLPITILTAETDIRHIVNRTGTTASVQILHYTDRPIRPAKGSNPLWHHNVNFKMWNLGRFDTPFIFIDLDAIVLADLDPLIAALERRPFTAINHEPGIPGETERFKFPFLNGGVQMVADPKFLDFEKIRNAYQANPRLKIPGAEQALLYNYFQSTGYSWTDPALGYEWNSFAKFVEFRPDGSAWSTHLNGHPVYISHYWSSAKPWRINCPLYQKYAREGQPT